MMVRNGYSLCILVLSIDFVNAFSALISFLSQSPITWIRQGFHFVDASTKIEPSQLSLITLFEDYRRAGRDGVTEFRRQITKTLENLSDDKMTVVETNIDKLWKLFNDETNQACGYFTIPGGLSRTDVQEIFVRLNTGGMQPTQADLVFSMIHVENYEFQNSVQEVVDDIRTATKIDLTIYDVLQVFWFIHYRTPSIDLDRLRKSKTHDLARLLDPAEQTLKAFYQRFLHESSGSTQGHCIVAK